jgi:hypothetical protein
MKMIKKLLVAVLAMAMVLGTMAVSTFAAEYEVKVTVEWAGDETLGDIDNMSLWIWGDGGVGLNYTESQAWPGDALTKNADGTWSGTFTVKENAVKVIPNVTVGDVVYQTVDSDSLDPGSVHTLRPLAARLARNDILLRKRMPRQLRKATLFTSNQWEILVQQFVGCIEDLQSFYRLTKWENGR